MPELSDVLQDESKTPCIDAIQNGNDQAPEPLRAKEPSMPELSDVLQDESKTPCIESQSKGNHHR
jgi:hypothetical protein